MENTINNVTFSSGVWKRDGHGNHRAIVIVEDASTFNEVRITWRRKDKFPQNKSLVIEDENGNKVTDFYPKEINRIYGDIIFQPTSGPGKYYIYYLPFIQAIIQDEKENDYFHEYILGSNKLRNSIPAIFPKAKHIAIEYRETPDAIGYNSMYPMEVIASKSEIKTLKDKYQNSILVFPEDREHPIKMIEDIPYRWIENGPKDSFYGNAQPNEFYVFQLGVYAAQTKADNLKLSYEPLKSTDSSIECSNITCFNLEGISYKGDYFTKHIDLPKDKIKPLWIGIDIPKTAQGEYKGIFTITSENNKPIPISININVSGEILEEKGYTDMNRLARLGWLNDTIGIEDTVIPPYTEVIAGNDKVEILDRTISINKNGLIDSITSRNHEILEKPIEFVIESQGTKEDFTNNSHKLAAKGKSYAEYESTLESSSFNMVITSKTEFDGAISYSVKIKAKKDTSVDDIYLNIPIKKDIAKYFIGYGLQGGYRKSDVYWKWDFNKIDHRVWLGDIEAGLQLDLRHPYDTWGLYYKYATGNPPSWDNNGLGGSNVVEDNNTVSIKAYSGKRSFKENEEIEFNFRFLVTPFHKIDPNHWDYTYSCFGTNKAANYVHQHHANDGYEYINYPFYHENQLRDTFINYNKENFKGINLYYTLRELTTYIPEVWAFESLDYEIYEKGSDLRNTQKEIFLSMFGGVGAWIKEHLYIDCHPEWRSILENGEIDPAISTKGITRLSNFYLKGLEYLLRHLPFDGLYLDGIGFDRRTMQRIARILEKETGKHRVNVHSYNMYDHFDVKVTPAIQLMEHMPYISNLWFGEEFNYDRTPDYWLIEASGIPFGLTSEMLLYGNELNQYRGMLYGMGARQLPNINAIWSFWENYNIKEAKMIGYYEDCPVTTNTKDVLATCYVKENETLIAIATWADEAVKIKLNIDFKALNIDKYTAKLYAPEIKDFQEEAYFNIDDEILIKEKQGIMLILK